MSEFAKAVNELALVAPLLKPRLLKGLVDCAKQDKQVDHGERELISAIAAIIDCPVSGLE